MKKLTLKILSVIMACVAAFSVAGCTKQGNENKEQEKPSTSQPKAFEGTHIYTAPETDRFLVKDGACAYTVVVPSVTSAFINKAKTEFLYFFKKATGISLRMISDDQLAYSEHSVGTKYISLGETSLLRSTDIDYGTELLEADGGRIKTKDDNIYIVGGSDAGTLFAVYTFMRITFNYESYTTNTIVIDENVRNLKLRDYDVTDVPDFYRRLPGSAPVQGDTKYSDYDAKYFMHRMGYRETNSRQKYRVHAVRPADNDQGFEVRNDIAEIGHTSDTILTKSEWYNLHPEWFSTNGLQWCYTARGDEASFELMTNMVVECIKYSLITYKESYPDAFSIAVQQEDNDEWCACEACGTLKSKYGTVMGSVIRFMNVVGKKIDAWMALPENAEYRNDNLKIEMFAYMGTENPPARYNETTKKWEPIDDSVILYKNIQVEQAYIYTDHQQSWFSEFNKEFKDKADGWAALGNADQFSWFLYDTLQYNPLYLYDSFNFYTSENFQYRASKGRLSMYVEGNAKYLACSAWVNLKTFLIARLSWDSSLSETELINDYFNAVYGPAAETMRTLFNNVRMYNYQQLEENELLKRHSIFNNVALKCEWKINVLDSWISLADKALTEVEIYKKMNPGIYDRYCYNIELEAISPIYIMLANHEDLLSSTKKNDLISRLRADFTRWPNMEEIGYAHMAGRLIDYVDSITVVE